jgi:hypothetical protein
MKNCGLPFPSAGINSDIDKFHLKKYSAKIMKAITKSAFFFMAMIALATSCSSKKTESTETTTGETSTMSGDSASTMMGDSASTMATDSASTMMSADSAK